MTTGNLTLEKIGKLAGVSRSTVSRVINNHESVKPEVRERVLQVIAETGYHPNPAARSLAGQRTHILGLVIPEAAQVLFEDPYFARLIQGIAQACNMYDYALSLFMFYTAEDEARLTPKILQTQLFDGLILTATYLNDPLLSKLLENQVPFVQVGHDDNPKISYIDSDNYNGAFTAVSHLIRLGYQRIATITGAMNNQATLKRRQGYIDAHTQRGRFVDENLIAVGDFSDLSGYEGMKQLLPYKPDAVFVAGDSMAIGALRALRQEAIVVPDEIALVGFDDVPPAAIADPPLTTVRQPIKQTGILAVETLIDILDNGPEPARHIILPTQLIIRRSCGAQKK